MRAREALLQILADEGVTCIFGNPGTTELPLMDELAGHLEFKYILSLQENTAVGMADGYAQAARRPSFVNLHTVSGLGGGMGNIANAKENRAPIVITAGQQDRRHLLTEPMLSSDLVGIMRTLSKWQHEVRSADELGTVMRRAFRESVSPPAGPVFVSIPVDVLGEELAAIPPRSRITSPAAPCGLEEVAELLVATPIGKLALVVGEEMAAAETFDDITQLAELLACPVYGTALYGAAVFPTDHPLWRGAVGSSASSIRETARQYKRILLLGGPADHVYAYSPGPAFPPEVEILQLSNDVSQLGRTYAVQIGLVGDVPRAVQSLVPLVGALADRQASRRAVSARLAESEATRSVLDDKACARYSERPTNPMAAVHALLRALPSDGVIVDESVSSAVYVRGMHRTRAPGAYYLSRGGGLGWAMPAALGVKLAEPERPVLCIVGDGAAMYSVQALYTAARYELDVVFAVLNNGQYRILRQALLRAGGVSAKADNFVAMDLSPPRIDYVALSASLGVAAATATTPDEVTEITRAAFASGRPSLVNIPIQGML